MDWIGNKDISHVGLTALSLCSREEETEIKTTGRAGKPTPRLGGAAAALPEAILGAIESERWKVGEWMMWEDPVALWEWHGDTEVHEWTCSLQGNTGMQQAFTTYTLSACAPSELNIYPWDLGPIGPGSHQISKWFSLLLTETGSHYPVLAVLELTLGKAAL